VSDVIRTPTESVAGENEMANLRLNNTLSVEIHPLPGRDGVLVSVIPPKEPSKRIKHVPCDIVLVIDVSGSMGSQAPVPTANESEVELNGLTVLDLTKHAARTILETLDEGDCLGVVTFSSEIEIIQELIPMTPENKKLARDRIDSLRVQGLTNLWHGILEGMKLFDRSESDNKVPAIMVLTDGMPNHM
jgi:Mg-chelatase subunit ChlD